MSNFKDYDEFLRMQASGQKRKQEELGEKLKNSRQQLEPWINDIFTLFKEYYETILLPRREFYMILKKKESLGKIDIHDNSRPYFTYRINLVPREVLPGAFDPFDVIGQNHLTPHVITQHDWHFEVSLQFEMCLFDSFDTSHTSLTGNLLPQIWLSTWGKLPDEQAMLIHKNLSISSLKAWKLTYTKIQLQGNPQELQTDLESTLMLLTPRVLAHLEEVWKIKS